MNFNLNLVAAIRALFAAFITSAVAINRVATIADKTLQLGENRIDMELKDQQATLAQLDGKRNQRVAKKVEAHDETWELQD